MSRFSKDKNLNTDCKNILYLNKMHFTQKEEIKKRKEKLFEDPNTYLTLPNENEFKFIIGKKLEGPRYNEEGNVISYSVVGGGKQLSKKLEKQNNSNFYSFASKGQINNKNIPSKQNLSLVSNKESTKIISDNELKSIFEVYKAIANQNHKRSLYKLHKKKICLRNDSKKLKYNSTDDLIGSFNDYINKGKGLSSTKKNKKKKIKIMPYTMRQYFNYHLNMQERCLLERDAYISETQTIGNHIKQKLLKPENKPFKSLRNMTTTFNTINTINTMNTMNTFNSSSINKTSSNFGNFCYSTINFDKNKNLLMETSSNFNNKLPSINNDYKNRKIWELGLRGNNYINDTSNKNLFIKDLEKVHYLNTENFKQNKSCKNCFLNNITLDVQGENLLSAEEKAIKTFKGSKRLFYFRYRPEELQDLMIKQNYNFKNHTIDQ